LTAGFDSGPGTGYAPNIKVWAAMGPRPNTEDTLGMGRLLSQNDYFSLEEQLKALGDDELLDFWEETQFLGKFLGPENIEPQDYSPEYERLILQELQYRSSRRTARA
jgi:hypothetical protein